MSSVPASAGSRRSPVVRVILALAALAALVLLVAGDLALAALPLVIAIAGVEIRTAFRVAGPPPSPGAVRIVDETTESGVRRHTR
jgi:hypothetical protein